MNNAERETTLSERITKTPKGMEAWQQERVIFEVTERICELMDRQGISRADLAGRLGTTRGYVTQLLNGNTNMTLRKISDVFLVLGRQFHPDDGPITLENNHDPVCMKVCNFRQAGIKPVGSRIHSTFATIGAGR